METIDRNVLLKHVKRAVIKVGSGVLTASDGLNVSIIEGLTNDMCTLRKI